MNFSPFGGHFPSAIPTIHQFAAKFTQDSVSTSNGVCIQPTIVQDTNNRYTANGVPSFTQHHHPSSTGAVHQIMSNKYQNGVPASTAMGTYPQNLYGHQSHLRNETNAKRFDPHQELAQELCAVMMQNSQEGATEDKNHEKLKLQPNNIQSQLNNQILNTPTSLPATWQSLATPGGSVADYLSHLPASTLPLSLHQFLKYSAENIKKETTQNHLNVTGNDLNFNLGQNGGLVATNSATLSTVNTAQLQGVVSASTKKKKKKKVDKEKKPRPKPGEIRLTTALDGSILYCCPECHMAYPEKELLEQHLVGHTLERRFVCDICGAGLKRKDHLTRHKQSHNPERPFVCTVCLKAFKRKEQLTLHFVIHSGEKRHICTECGKGFYRKDHLRKHTRSHIARRVKAELSQSGQSGNGASGASLNIGS